MRSKGFKEHLENPSIQYPSEDTLHHSHRYELLKWKGTGRLACDLALIHLIGEII